MWGLRFRTYRTVISQRLRSRLFRQVAIDSTSSGFQAYVIPRVTQGCKANVRHAKEQAEDDISHQDDVVVAGIGDRRAGAFETRRLICLEYTTWRDRVNVCTGLDRIPARQSLRAPYVRPAIVARLRSPGCATYWHDGLIRCIEPCHSRSA